MTNAKTWEKACDCYPATATSPSVHWQLKDGIDNGDIGVMIYRVMWEPGPVCDRCHTPWRLEH